MLTAALVYLAVAFPVAMLVGWMLERQGDDD
jgi:hypothetical protein